MEGIKEYIVANGHGWFAPTGLAVHSTDNVGVSAGNHASYWSKTPMYAVHYVTDWTQTLHTVPDDRLCYHVGNANKLFLGLEICEGATREQFDNGWKNAVAAAKVILIAHGWTADNLVSHDWCRRVYGGTTHSDPIPYFSRWGKTWDNFVSDVRTAMNPPAPPKKHYVCLAHAEVSGSITNLVVPMVNSGFAALPEICGEKPINSLGYKDSFAYLVKGSTVAEKFAAGTAFAVVAAHVDEAGKAKFIALCTQNGYAHDEYEVEEHPVSNKNHIEALSCVLNCKKGIDTIYKV